ncbi:MAG: hypothetical protein HY898_03100 [Deltaproteobacteria bacterium]|nr:hypothetical protein [Deltaproteobacteria bacterium]
MRHARTLPWKWGLFAAAWSLCILAGVAWLKGTVPERTSPLLATLSASEPFHVLAHSVLYGTLAASFLRLLRRPTIAVLSTVLVGAVQEKLQVIFAGRGMGEPELFDLAVDCAAAMIAVLACAWMDRRPVTDQAR